jgi:hypothetical protein
MSASTRFERFAALAVLAVLGVSWPVLELLGNNAEFFLARSASRWETVLTALVIGVVLPGLLGLLGLLPGKPGLVIALTVMGVLATALAFLFLRRLPLLPGLIQAIALAMGATTPFVFQRLEAARMLFRYLSPAPLLVPLLFVFSTPTGGTVTDREVAAQQANPPNPVTVVMVVLDEFPVVSLIDPDGNLRADRYPNFARLAEDGTWFRNAVTIEQQTEHSVPAMLTGFVPDQALEPFAGQYPNSIFTTLAGSHQMEVDETITRLCPLTICSLPPSTETFGARAHSMGSDITVIAGHVLLPEWATLTLPQIDRSWGDFGAASADFNVIDAFNDAAKHDPRQKLEDLASRIANTGSSAAPTFYFAHALLPHYPWQFLPDGRRYPLSEQRVPGTIKTGWGDDDWLIAQGLQRHLLQVEYVDAAIGRLIDAMDETGIYDEAMLIVLADHGISFEANLEHWRRILPETVGDIAAIPLFVKAPGHPGGIIDDRRALTTDLVPTIADLMGFELSWETDGVPLFGPDPQRVETTTVGPSTSATFGVDGTEKLVMAARNAGWFPNYDPWELLPPGAPDLRGEHIEDVAQGETSFSVEIDRPSWYTNVDPGKDGIPIRVTGVLRAVDSEVVLGVAVNGVIGAITRSYVDEDETSFQALVPPNLFQSGTNEVDIVLIDGDDVSFVPRR